MNAWMGDGASFLVMVVSWTALGDWSNASRAAEPVNPVPPTRVIGSEDMMDSGKV